MVEMAQRINLRHTDNVRDSENLQVRPGYRGIRFANSFQSAGNRSARELKQSRSNEGSVTSRLKINLARVVSVVFADLETIFATKNHLSFFFA